MKTLALISESLTTFLDKTNLIKWREFEARKHLEFNMGLLKDEGKANIDKHSLKSGSMPVAMRTMKALKHLSDGKHSSSKYATKESKKGAQRPHS